MLGIYTVKRPTVTLLNISNVTLYNMQLFQQACGDKQKAHFSSYLKCRGVSKFQVTSKRACGVIIQPCAAFLRLTM